MPGRPHRWTVEEYEHLALGGGLDTRVELIEGEILDKWTDGRAHRWTLEEYERLAEHGGFHPDLRVELLDGEVVDKMSPQGTPHATAVRAVETTLREAFGPEADVRTQLPFTLADGSEPEPDVAVVPGTFRDYRRAHPREALLVVEVADSTLALDRTRKQALYAKAGVPEYWIVNVPDACLEVYRGPSGEAYRTKQTLGPEATVAPLARPEATIAVEELLP